MNDMCGIAARRLRDAAEAGGDGASLRELTTASRPVPPGFVLRRSSFADPMWDWGHHRRLVHGARRVLPALSQSAMQRGEG